MITDGSGNTTTCSFNVIVQDTELPVIATCGAIIDTTVIADAGVCNYANNGSGWDAVGTDNCSIDSISYVLSGATTASGLTTLDGVVFELDTTMVTWMITDGSGNTTTCSFNVIVQDTELPVITTCGIVTDTNVVADAGVCTYTNSGAGWDAVGTDNCSIDSISYVLSGATTASGLTTLDGVVFELDTTMVTWMITDGSGNTTTCSFNVIVQDTELPVITTCGIVTDTNVVADAGVCTYTNSGAGWDALGTDNCSIDSISYVLSGSTTGNGLTTLDGVAFNNGTTTVVWTVTDGSGNTATCQFDVIVTDTQAPVIAAVLNDTTVECSPVAPVAFDNCGPVTGVSDFTTYAGDTVVTVTWTFTDVAGNTATAAQTITYDDVTAPDATVIADAVAECDTTVSAATTTDLCMGTITGTTTDPLSYSAQGTYTITWTFDDTNGNTTTATQTVIIQDVTAPSITAPATVNVLPNNAGCTAIIADLGTAVTNDNCQVVSVVNDGPGVYPLGATTVTWTVTDIGGNTSTATQTVNVLPLTSTIDTVACDVYISPDGIDLTPFGSGTYTAVVPGSFGCDSTITINLTLNQSTTSTITLSSCDTYTAPDGAVYTNSGTYTAIIQNAAGCDSTITINLTIDSIETSAIELNDLVFSALQSTQVQYQWVSCDNGYAAVSGATQQNFDVTQYPIASGYYAVILTNNTCIDTSNCVNVSIETIVPQLVTPNGDGNNDVFEIQGVYDYPNNILEIYNRWGNLVYRQESYQNTWGGECTEGLTLGGDILPAGTYFYTFDKGLNDGSKPVKGYIFLTK
jgi:gliding motility-associated-like protein